MAPARGARSAGPKGDSGALACRGRRVRRTALAYARGKVDKTAALLGESIGRGGREGKRP